MLYQETSLLSEMGFVFGSDRAVKLLFPSIVATYLTCRVESLISVLSYLFSGYISASDETTVSYGGVFESVWWLEL